MLLVILACSLACWPLANPDLGATSDGLYHLLRAVELFRQWQAGVPYPRWAPDFYLGYGYPIFLFTPLLPYSLVAALHGAGLAFPQAMNLVEGAALIGSGVLAYAWLRRVAAPWAATVGALLYALAPYHLVNLYFRGDLAEFLAATTFPAILLGIALVVQSPGVRPIALLTGSIAALLLTHFLSAMLFLPVAALVSLIALSTARPIGPRAGALALSGILAALLTAFSWLPALAMAHDATFAKLLRFYNFRANFATVAQLFSPRLLQTYTPVFSGTHGFGYQLGLLQSVALVGGALGSAVAWRRSSPALRRLWLAMVAVALVALLCCLEASAPLWNALPALQLVQFPWRFLAVAAVPAAFLAARAVDALSGRTGQAVALAASVAVAVSTLALLQPPRLAVPAGIATPEGIARFELLYHLAGTSAAAEYLPPTAPDRQTISAVAFQRVLGRAAPADPAASVAEWRPAGTTMRFSFDAPRSSTVVLPVLSFPGWIATVDGHPAATQPSPGAGLISLDLPPGRHDVQVTLARSGPVWLGDATSALAMALVILFLASMSWKKFRRRARIPRRAADTDAAAASSDPPRLGGTVSQAGLRIGMVVIGALALTAAASGGRGTAGGWQPLDVDLTGGVHVGGYALRTGGGEPAPSVRAAPGGALLLDVAVQASGHQQLAVQLTDGAGTDWADWRMTPQASDATASLGLPPALPPGLYALRIGTALPGGLPSYALNRANRVELLPVDGTLLIGPITVAGNPVSAVTGPPVGIWPGYAVLSSPSLPSSVRAGALLQPAWTWQAPAQPAGSRLTEVIHVVDGAGHLVAAANTEPAAGYFPTLFWQPGEAILDRLTVAIPADTPPGRYSVRVGWLDAGRGLPAENGAGVAGGNDVAVGTVQVLPPTAPAAWDGRGDRIGALSVELDTPLPKATPGDPLTVALRWHAEAPVSEDETAELQLRAGGVTVTSKAFRVGGEDYPPAQWRPGETERQLVDLAVPGTAPAGPAQLVLVTRLAAGQSPPIVLGTVQLAGRPHVFVAHPATTVNATFANGTKLIGFDLRSGGALVRAGLLPSRSPLSLVLYWQAGGPTARPLKVSAQLLSSTGSLLTQADTPAGGGSAPSTSWRAGEIVTSTHQLVIAVLPAGSDRLIVVLYDPSTGERVSTAHGDTVTLATLTLP